MSQSSFDSHMTSDPKAVCAMSRMLCSVVLCGACIFGGLGHSYSKAGDAESHGGHAVSLIGWGEDDGEFCMSA